MVSTWAIGTPTSKYTFCSMSFEDLFIKKKLSVCIYWLENKIINNAFINKKWPILSKLTKRIKGLNISEKVIMPWWISFWMIRLFLSFIPGCCSKDLRWMEEWFRTSCCRWWKCCRFWWRKSFRWRPLSGRCQSCPNVFRRGGLFRLYRCCYHQ